MFFESEVIDTVVRALLLSGIALCWIIVVVRVIGLRAFSKMTAFDFVVTVSIGSLLAGASQASTWPAFVQAALAMAMLLGTQWAIARLRQRSDEFEGWIQNTPVLLVHDGKIIHSALSATRVAEDDLIAKLREANVKSFEDVRAVVLETTGDISVLHGEEAPDNRLLMGVQQIGKE